VIAQAERTRPIELVTIGYAVTAIGTGSIGLVRSAWAITSLRCFAWVGRGVRGPLRDHMLADEVDPSQFGRAYGVERSADMLGALLGPLTAAGMIALGSSVRSVILWSMLPSALAAASILFLTRDRGGPDQLPITESPAAGKAISLADRKQLPREFWWLVGGVTLFGLGDFSRTFLIVVAAGALGEVASSPTALLSTAVLIYAGHNLVSAFAWAGAIMLFVKTGSATLSAFGLNAWWGPFIPAVFVIAFFRWLSRPRRHAH